MLRSLICSIYLILITSCFSFAQIIKNDSTIVLIPNWVKGEMANFTYRQSRERYKEGALYSYDAYITTISMQVLKSTKSSKTILWSYNTIESEIPNQNQITNDIAALTKGLNIRYTVNSDGSFKSLKNWKKVKKYILTSLDVLSEKYASDAVDTLLNQARDLYSFKENIEQLVISDIQLFHTLYGNEYILDRKEKVLTAYPYGEEESIPAVLTYELTQLDKKKKFAKVVLRQFVDTEDKFVKENFLNIPLTRDYNEFDIDTKKGWITKAQFVREVKEGSYRSVDSYELKKL